MLLRISVHTVNLVDFAVKCDIPLIWLDRAKEDYPEDSQVVVNKSILQKVGQM